MADIWTTFVKIWPLFIIPFHSCHTELLSQPQCDQIWRFFGLWATFIDIWRFLSGHTGAGPHIQELAFTKSMFSLLKKIDKIDTVTLLQAMEKYI